MPRGSKEKYTDKQKRQAEHIEVGYQERGVGKDEAERRAWATVNKSSGGGKKSGSGRGKKVDKSPMKQGGRKGGRAAAKSGRSEVSSGRVSYESGANAGIRSMSGSRKVSLV